jgi:hypothetical protein
MEDPLLRSTIDNNFCAGGGEKTRHPIDKSTGEAQVTKQVGEE